LRRWPRDHAPLGTGQAPELATPRLAPTQRLDFELELGIFIGRPNARGEPVPMDRAEDHVFGLALFNDWSARDMQAWEYQPLGPFLSKNFASTVSPWIVTLEALVPFRRGFGRPTGDPQPLPYLDSDANREQGALDIELEVLIRTPSMREHGRPAERISNSNFADAAYWTLAQLIAHHTVGGCSLRSGDLLATGTLSGPLPEQAGSMLELSQAGKARITLNNGKQRSFLADGDEVTLRAHCARTGWRRIGFGACTAQVVAARS
jgi:fumarylacetoacetase